jgi:hypothetical protein
VWVAQKIVRRIQPRWGKAVAVLFFIGILVADGIYGRIKLAAMCTEQGGLRIYRTVQNVEGFYSPFAGEKFLKNHDYAFIESGSSKPYVRYAKQPNGAISQEKTSELKSRFAYRTVRGDLGDVYMIDRFQVIDRERNEVLAETVNYVYAGGWIERAIASLYAARGEGGSCDIAYPTTVHEQLISRTLNPGK